MPAHPDASAQYALRAGKTAEAQVYAMLAVAAGLESIASAIADLKRDFLSIEIVSPVEVKDLDLTQ